MPVFPCMALAYLDENLNSLEDFNTRLLDSLRGLCYKPCDRPIFGQRDLAPKRCRKRVSFPIWSTSSIES